MAAASSLAILGKTKLEVFEEVDADKQKSDTPVEGREQSTTENGSLLYFTAL